MDRHDIDSLQSVVWDFNGTILDDLGLTVATINRLLKARKLPAITKQEHREAFRFPISDYYDDLGLISESEDFEKLSRLYHELYMEGVGQCRLHDGIRDALAFLEKEGIRQYVLSAMHEPHLKSCISDLGIGDYFDAVFGLKDLYARSKIERGHQCVSECAIDPARTALIGDTEHDMEVARVLGMVPVAAAWGHQSAGMFEANIAALAEGPHELIGDFGKLPRTVLVSAPASR